MHILMGLHQLRWKPGNTDSELPLQLFFFSSNMMHPFPRRFVFQHKANALTSEKMEYIDLLLKVRPDCKDNSTAMFKMSVFNYLLHLAFVEESKNRS